MQGCAPLNLPRLACPCAPIGGVQPLRSINAPGVLCSPPQLTEAQRSSLQAAPARLCSQKCGWLEFTDAALLFSASWRSASAGGAGPCRSGSGLGAAGRTQPSSQCLWCYCRQTRESLRPAPTRGPRLLPPLDPRTTTRWATQVQLPPLRVSHSAGVSQT